MQHVPRQPVWSEFLTTPLAARVPVRWRPAVLDVIKPGHTAIFFSVAGLIVLFAWDGVRQRPRRRTVLAAGVALAESAIYASNNQVCPLTPLAEELGAPSGSVADIFLPDWISQRIPVFSVGVLLVGLVLNTRAWLDLRSARAAVD
jgi:hypothetical protein